MIRSPSFENSMNPVCPITLQVWFSVFVLASRLKNIIVIQPIMRHPPLHLNNSDLGADLYNFFFFCHKKITSAKDYFCMHHCSSKKWVLVIYMLQTKCFFQVFNFRNTCWDILYIPFFSGYCITSINVTNKLLYTWRKCIYSWSTSLTNRNIWLNASPKLLESCKYTNYIRYELFQVLFGINEI